MRKGDSSEVSGGCVHVCVWVLTEKRVEDEEQLLLAEL